MEGITMEDWCKIQWEVKRENDRLRTVIDLKNNGTIPIEKIRMKLRFDSRGLRRMDHDKLQINHLLPGHSCNFDVRLEPRKDIEGAILIFRVQALVNDEKMQIDVPLGEYDVQLKNRRTY